MSSPSQAYLQAWCSCLQRLRHNRSRTPERLSRTGSGAAGAGVGAGRLVLSRFVAVKSESPCRLTRPSRSRRVVVGEEARHRRRPSQDERLRPLRRYACQEAAPEHLRKSLGREFYGLERACFAVSSLLMSFGWCGEASSSWISSSAALSSRRRENQSNEGVA